MDKEKNAAHQELAQQPYDLDGDDTQMHGYERSERGRVVGMRNGKIYMGISCQPHGKKQHGDKTFRIQYGAIHFHLLPENPLAVSLAKLLQTGHNRYLQARGASDTVSRKGHKIPSATSWQHPVVQHAFRPVTTMERIFPFLLFLAAGTLLKKIPSFPDTADRSLNLYVIYIALPALILLQVPGLAFSSHLLATILLPWIVVALSSLVVLALCRMFGWSREITGALLLMIPLGNTSFLGIPMVEQFFGAEAVRYAVLYDQFGSFLALSSYGTLILAVYGSGAQPTPTGIIRNIVLFPPFLALAASLLLPLDFLLAWLHPALEMAAGSLVPVVLVAIGLQMRLLLPREDLFPFALGLFLRLLFIPFLLISACRMLGLSGEPIRVALFESAMPSMVTAGALASIAGLKPGLTSALVGFGILISFVTLPIIFFWLP